ncbi:hypothetical protein QTQ03_00510 [Micromonospora sp. WMMA1363]|uniref:hypothetical protein n=1 Tax=Micromonospora sp. WMMA1363 TaxID=3053985 RepID=UPI00259CFA0C|nr:hypothetical protein [Micromonospora sp. WMMA1363]MDM4718145.1 hypothetical protein [Micromonospora sp. WMMA1363]
MTLWRYALRAGVILACVAGVALAAPTSASAANSTELSGLPDEFRAGDQVATVSAVVRRDQGGCVKVRWSMVLRVSGLRLDQVKMDRIEDTGSFPLEIRTEGDVARLTDRQLDPGTLCPDRTVTARYLLAFAEDVSRGRITLEAEAYDANLRLLARQTATRTVVGRDADPAPSDSAVTSEAPTEPTDPAGARTEEEVPADDGVAEVPAAGAGGRPVARSGASEWCRRPSCSAGCCSHSASGCCCAYGSSPGRRARTAVRTGAGAVRRAGHVRGPAVADRGPPGVATGCAAFGGRRLRLPEAAHDGRWRGGG